MKKEPGYPHIKSPKKLEISFIHQVIHIFHRKKGPN